MDFTPISSTDYNTLKCTLCTNYLSHFPVHLTSHHKVCGRCEPPDNDQFCVQDGPYEAVAKFLKFPCRYRSEGCPDEMLPKDVPAHETVCGHRIVPCRVAGPTACTWKGPRPNLMTHCREQHSDMVLKEGEFQMDLSQTYESHNFISCDDILFAVTRVFNSQSKTLACGVYHLPNILAANGYSCRLNVKGPNKSLSVEFQITNIEEKSLTRVFLETVRNREDNLSLVFGKFSIHKETAAVSHSSDNNSNLELLSILKCSVCRDYIMPPVYFCSCNSVNLCVECREKHICPAKDGNTLVRNINLDKIANLLDYPCARQPSGCNFWAKPDQMKIHQNTCNFKISGCPATDLVTCAWKGVAKNVVSHMTAEHVDLISNASTFNTKVHSELFFALIKFSERLFRLFYTNRDNTHYWTVQPVLCSPDLFKYQIEVLDSNNAGRRLLIQQPCSPFVWRKRLFKNSDLYCCFSNDLLSRYVNNGNIMFKVHICT